MNIDWERFNHLTQSYETKDGTTVAGELVENIECMADLLIICRIRELKDK